MSAAIEAALSERLLLIGGERRPGSGGAWLDIVKPADEAVIGRLAVATPADPDEALPPHRAASRLGAGPRR